MFKPDITKQAQKIIFSWKTLKHFHTQVFLSEGLVERSVAQKHLGLHLDQKLDFKAWFSLCYIYISPVF